MEIFPKKNKFRFFAKRLFAFGAIGFLILQLPFWIYVCFLRSFGEMLYSKDIVELGRKRPIVWGSGYYDSGILKPAIAKRIDPRVVIFGSSRVMQFRGKSFHKLAEGDFYNIGGSVRDMHEAVFNLKGFLRSKPRLSLIVLGLDFWWFQASKPGFAPLKKWLLPMREAKFGIAREFEFYADQFLLLQKAGLDPDAYRAFSSPRVDPFAHRSQLGVGAFKGGGFRNDGSFLYWKELKERMSPIEKIDRQQENLQIPKADLEGRFSGNAIREDAFGDLSEFIGLCKANHIDLIAFAPPIEKGALALLRSRPQSARFWDEFPDRVSKLFQGAGVDFFDFTDPSPIGPAISSDAFFDWCHGGETLYGRILSKMCQTGRSRDLLEKNMDCDRLNDEVSRARSPLLVYGD